MDKLDNELKELVKAMLFEHIDLNPDISKDQMFDDVHDIVDDFINSLHLDNEDDEDNEEVTELFYQLEDYLAEIINNSF